MTEEQRAYIEKSHRALASARRILKVGDPEGAIDRAYYAAFDVAMAALLGEGERPKTHSGTHNQFHLHFIRTERIDRAMGATLKHAFELRQRATYEALTVFDEAVASDLIGDVGRFVEAVEALLA